MNKLFLPAKVPNEGARRLAAWLNDASPILRGVAMTRAGMDAGKIARLVEGELIPGADDRWAITQATGDAVAVRDWSIAARGRWGDPVPTRTFRRAA